MSLQRLLLVLLCLIQLVYLATAARPSQGRSGKGRTRHDPYTIDVRSLTESRMVLMCFKNLRRILDARWTKNGRPLEEVAAGSSRVRIHVANVTIDPVLPEDEGKYRCNDGKELPLTSTHSSYNTQCNAYYTWSVVPSDRCIMYLSAVPPYVNQSQPLSLTKELGSTFTLPCGIVLGPISLTRSYEVEWQRLSKNGTRLMSISSCIHSDPSFLDSPEQNPNNCNPNLNMKDFSLTIPNFTLTDSDLNSPVRDITFKCIVEQRFSPSFHPFSIPRTTKTIVSFQYGETSLHDCY